MNQQMNYNSLAERLVDNPAPSMSLRDTLSKVFLRPKLFALAVLVPTIIAASMSAMVPTEWAASTKVLIRYKSVEEGILKNLVAQGGLNLSGATSAEMIKSVPVLERTIDKVGITEDDVYKDSSRVLTDKFSAFLKPIFGGDDDNQGLSQSAEVALERKNLIRNFKSSLESSSKKTSKSASVAILEKGSQIPESMKLDEVITLEVKSFNRDKVDDMANGLAESFIEEYYSLYTQYAKRQSDYVDGLIAKEEEELTRVEHATAADLLKDKGPANGGGRDHISREIPILASLSTELSVAEAALTKAQQTYASGSQQVKRLSQQVGNLKFMLEKQERIEIQKQLIEELKTKRYQAQNTEKISKNDLVPISIIERAEEPKKSSTKKMTRVLVSAVIGLVLGLILAISLMVIFNVLDPRIHFKNDLVDLDSAPVVGQIPEVDNHGLGSPNTISGHEKINQSAWELITRLGEKNTGSLAKVIVISSSAESEGATLCSAILALNLAKSRNQKVCLIDANLNNSGLTHLFNVKQKTGLIEAISNGNIEFSPLMEGRLWVLGAGNLAARTQLGHYANEAQTFVERLKSEYDFIVVDAGATLKSNESLVFGKLADQMVLVASSGVSRKNTFTAAVQKLNANAIGIDGIIFNRTKRVLPEFLYKLF